MCFQIEGPQLMQYGFKDAIVKVGLSKFLSDLFLVGMFFHLYNQVLYVLTTSFMIRVFHHICDWFIYCGIR